MKRIYRVRCNDEVEAQRRRWTFYETINTRFKKEPPSQTMNPFYAFLSSAYIFAIFFLADSGAVSQLGEFNPYSLLHIPLYGILTFLILLSLCTGKGKYTPQRVITGGFIAGIAGALDEFHQTFISTRDGSLGDVLLDVLGIVLAILLFRLVPPFLKSKSLSTGKNA